MGNPKYDLTGQRFGRLTVIECMGSAHDHHKIWKCKCDCGNFTTVPSNALKLGRTQSCGCLALEHTVNMGKNSATHHLRHTRLYNIWANMKQRCCNTDHPRFKDYGARGIRVCDEWLDSFENFYKWAISNGYDKKLTIDRIDNDGIYEPSNCKWSTYKEQAQNKRNTNRKR